MGSSWPRGVITSPSPVSLNTAGWCRNPFYNHNKITRGVKPTRSEWRESSDRESAPEVEVASAQQRLSFQRNIGATRKEYSFSPATGDVRGGFAFWPVAVPRVCTAIIVMVRLETG